MLAQREQYEYLAKLGADMADKQLWVQENIKQELKEKRWLPEQQCRQLMLVEEEQALDDTLKKQDHHFQ